jgi:hypothetical protein
LFACGDGEVEVTDAPAREEVDGVPKEAEEVGGEEEYEVMMVVVEADPHEDAADERRQEEGEAAESV